jgi:lyso-ornithine lipid O-acyltransferase
MRLRIYLRIISIFLMTCILILKLLIKRAVYSSRKKQLADEYRFLWSKKAVDILGINIRVSGEIPDFTCIAASNHRSIADPPVIMSVFNCSMLSKAEVRDIPVIGFGAMAVNILFVKREKIKSRGASMVRIREAYEEGTSVAVFPEGTTNGSEKDLLPFSQGIFNLAARHNLKLVPIAIQYGIKEDNWKDGESMFAHVKRAFSKRQTIVNVRFGNSMRSSDENFLKIESEKWILTALKELSNQ